MQMEASNSRPLRVFWSYSHKDEAFREALAVHLAVLRRNGLITDWHDRKIGAGTVWREEIDRHLLEADLVLLLVSASFFDSDYCWGNEMNTALALHRENKARVVPVILHPCQWRLTPLSELQAVPKDGKPISKWTNEHEAFDDVVSHIALLVTELRRAEQARREAEEERWRAEAEAQEEERRQAEEEAQRKAAEEERQAAEVRRSAEEQGNKGRAEEHAQAIRDEVPAPNEEPKSPRKVLCSNCSGTGRSRSSYHGYPMGHVEYDVPCSFCEGKGYWVLDLQKYKGN